MSKNKVTESFFYYKIQTTMNISEDDLLTGAERVGVDSVQMHKLIDWLNLNQQQLLKHDVGRWLDIEKQKLRELLEQEYNRINEDIYNPEIEDSHKEKCKIDNEHIHYVIKLIDGLLPIA